MLVFQFFRKNTPAAIIFDSMSNETFQSSIVVTKAAKRLAWAVVIFINIYFVYFSVLRSISRSTAWQRDYLAACIIQLLVEIFVYETGECLWIYFTIPNLVREDVATTMATVKHAIDLAFRNDKALVVLDSPKYFFASRRLAEEFPDQFESSVVRAFHSYYPPSELDMTCALKPDDMKIKLTAETLHSTHEVPVMRKKKANTLMTFVQRFNASVLLVLILQYIGTVPIRIQQVIIHTLQPIVLSLIFILIIYFQKYPTMALVPMGFIIYETILHAYRSRNLIAKRVPAINDADKNSSMLGVFASQSNNDFVLDGVSSVSSGFSFNNDIGVSSKEEEKAYSDGNGAVRNAWASIRDNHKPDTIAIKVVEGTADEVAVDRYDIDAYVGNDGDDDGDDDIDDDGIYSISDIDDEVVRLEGARKASNPDNEDSYLFDVEDSDDQIPAGVTDKELYIKEKAFLQSETALKKFLIQSGSKNLEDFEFHWPEDSDEYMYYYKPKITPFVNRKGEQVSIFHVIAKRNDMMMSDFQKYESNKLLAAKGIERRRKEAVEWDNYRWYKSDLAFPFIDYSGNLVKVSSILAARDFYKEDCIRTSGILSDEQEEQLDALRRDKQMKEYALMLHREEAADQWAGELFLSNFRDHMHNNEHT